MRTPGRREPEPFIHDVAGAVREDPLHEHHCKGVPAYSGLVCSLGMEFAISDDSRNALRACVCVIQSYVFTILTVFCASPPPPTFCERDKVV